MRTLLMFASLITFLFGCSAPSSREINRFQAPPPKGSELANQLAAIPGLRRQPSGHYAGLNEIVAEHFPVGSSEELLIAFLNREGFGEPLPPSDIVGGFDPRVRFTGPSQVDQRKREGSSLTGSFLEARCGFGWSIYKVTWRTNDTQIVEIFSDVLRCAIDAR